MAVDMELNLLRLSRCEMLHFVTSDMKQNKSCKQTIESAQNRLEIIFTGRENAASLGSWGFYIS